MNVFKFLKGKAGKMVFGATQLAGTSVIGGLLLVSAWSVTNPPKPAENVPIRSFSQIAQGRAENNAINVTAGSTRFATAEERANLDGTANDFGLGNEKYVDNLSVSAPGSVGTGYQMGGSEGLGMGANQAVETGSSRASGNAVDPAANVTTRGIGAAAGPGALSGNGGEQGGEGPKKLANASIARATGGSGSVTMAASARTGSSAPGSRAGAAGPGGNGINYTAPGSAISGAMPEGSNIVSRGGFNRGGQGDMAGIGGSRGGRAAGGTHSKDGRDLAFIAKRSADAAKNKNRSANEGSRAFLASTQNSGGLTTEGASEDVGSSASSEDFEAPQIAKERNAQSALDNTSLLEAERASRRQKIKSQLVALLIASIPAVLMIRTLWDAASAGGPFTVWMKVAAIAIAAAMTVWWGTLIANAFMYKSDYGDSSWAWASLGAGAAFTTLIWGSMFIRGIQKAVNAVVNKINGFFGTNLLSKGTALVGGLGLLAQSGSGISSNIGEMKNTSDLRLDDKKK